MNNSKNQKTFFIVLFCWIDLEFSYFFSNEVNNMFRVGPGQGFLFKSKLFNSKLFNSKLLNLKKRFIDNNLICTSNYQFWALIGHNGPRLLPLGTTQTVTESRKTGLVKETGKVELLEGKITQNSLYKRVELDGRFEFIAPLRCMAMVQGDISTFYLKSNQQKKVSGVFKNYPGYGMGLIDGQEIRLDGEIREGRWAYIQELDNVRLIEGSITNSNGIRRTGRWTFRPSTREMRMLSDPMTRPKKTKNEPK